MSECSFCGEQTDKLTNEYVNLACVECANDLARMEAWDEAAMP